MTKQQLNAEVERLKFRVGELEQRIALLEARWLIFLPFPCVPNFPTTFTPSPLSVQPYRSPGSTWIDSAGIPHPVVY